MAALAVPDGTRYSIQNREFAHRRASDGVVLKSEEITSSQRLLELLKTHFGLEIALGTKFGVAGF